MEIFPDRMVRVTVSGPNAAQCRVQSTVPLEDGVWYHIVMTHAPGDTRLYLDGVLAGQGKYPIEVMHNTEADLLIAGRDHAQYPMDRFGMFDFAEVTVWSESLAPERIRALYEEREGLPGVGKEGTPQTALVEYGTVGRLTWNGIKPPTKVLPLRGPGNEARNETKLLVELKALVSQGRWDRAASPEFLDALEGLLEKYSGKGDENEEKPSDKLPLKADFKGPGMPTGWNAVDPSVWRFGDGAARQVESLANTRYVLYYEPGMAWKDYEMRVKFESDKWLIPPGTSAAAAYVRYKGVDDAYRVTWTGDGTLILDSCEAGGKLRLLASREMPVEMVKDGLEWRVTVQEEVISVWHGDKRMLEVRDGTHHEGTVGMESIHIPMRFSGVEVK